MQIFFKLFYIFLFAINSDQLNPTIFVTLCQLKTNKSSQILKSKFPSTFNQLFIFSKILSSNLIKLLLLNNSLTSKISSSFSIFSISFHKEIFKFPIFVLLSFVIYHPVHKISHNSAAIDLI